MFGQIQLREKWEDSEQSQKVKGKTKKVLKTDPLFTKHAFFTIRVSRQQVARASRQNIQKQNCEKVF